MGGLGSGRSAWRNAGTVESRLSIDIGGLHRAGALAPGAVARWRWTFDSREASVGTLARVHAVVLVFSLGGVQQRHEVRVERLACHFGGSRPWFRCPSCQRRTTQLFLPRCYCRKCERLAYRSQRADLTERGWMKIRKACRALSLAPEAVDRIAHLTKPKGMHWRTFWRHTASLKRGEQMRSAWMITPSRTLLRFLGRSSPK